MGKKHASAGDTIYRACELLIISLTYSAVSFLFRWTSKSWGPLYPRSRKNEKEEIDTKIIPGMIERNKVKSESKVLRLGHSNAAFWIILPVMVFIIYGIFGYVAIAFWNFVHPFIANLAHTWL